MKFCYIFHSNDWRILCKTCQCRYVICTSSLFSRISHLISLPKKLLFASNYSHRAPKVWLVQLHEKYKSFVVVFLSRKSWYWSITSIGAYQPSRSNAKIRWAWRSWSEISVPSKHNKFSLLELVITSCSSSLRR